MVLPKILVLLNADALGRAAETPTSACLPWIIRSGPLVAIAWSLDAVYTDLAARSREAALSLLILKRRDLALLREPVVALAMCAHCACQYVRGRCTGLMHAETGGKASHTGKGYDRVG